VRNERDAGEVKAGVWKEISNCDIEGRRRKRRNRGTGERETK